MLPSEHNSAFVLGHGRRNNQLNEQSWRVELREEPRIGCFDQVNCSIILPVVQRLESFKMVVTVNAYLFSEGAR